MSKAFYVFLPFNPPSHPAKGTSRPQFTAKETEGQRSLELAQGHTAPKWWAWGSGVSGPLHQARERGITSEVATQVQKTTPTGQGCWLRAVTPSDPAHPEGFLLAGAVQSAVFEVRPGTLSTGLSQQTDPELLLHRWGN